MSEYIVSARKYRPQTFDTVVGQEHITTTLKNAIKNQHLAHAYLFCGPRGVGKTTCARILAKTINCETPTEDMEACGVCPNCISNSENHTSYNVFELDAASNNGVENIRELISKVTIPPHKGTKYKVYIIDEVHMLTGAAFNAFLKTLEEPPPYAIFILATTEKHKILPTILSRCQIFDFRRITTHDIVAHLQSIAAKEGMIAQEAALHIIAQKSEGAMRDALSMLDRIASFTNGMLTYSNTMEHLNLLDADFYFGLTDGMLSQDVAGTLLKLDHALEKGFEGDVIINGLAEHFRNLMLCKDSRMVKLLDVPNDFKPVYNEKAYQAPPSFILSALNVINDSELNYKQATNKRLHVEMCLIRICFLLQSSSSSGSAGNDVFDDVKKNSSSVVNSGFQNEAAKINTPVTKPVTPESQPAPVVQEEPKPYPAKTPTILATPLPDVVPAVPSTPQPAPPATPVAPTAAGKSRRLSTNMLSDIDEKVTTAASKQNEAQVSLSLVTALSLFELYKQKLAAANKNVIHAQFSLMQLEVIPPDEIRIISPSELTDTYARDQKSQMIDFFSAETNSRVRITTEIREDESVKAAQNTVVLSRSETFDAMVQKNPALAKLKDSLGMTIEY